MDMEVDISTFISGICFIRVGNSEFQKVKRMLLDL